MCGDSKSFSDLKAFLKEEKANVIVTSPPYADQRDYGIGSFNWDDLMIPVFENITHFLSENGHILINLGPSHKDRKVNFYWNPWLDSAESIGWPLFGLYIWDKGSGFPGHHNGRLGPSHEYVFHFNKESLQANKWIETTGEAKRRGSGGMRFRQKDGSMKPINNPETIGQDFKIPDSVIRVNREMSRGLHTENHPAVYPVEFAEFLINTWSKPNDIILDPFAGSGSTLIACEKNNRRCFSIDINPSYCDVIIERWEKYSGKQAVKLN
jgi:DNA modification methylase